MLSLFKRTKKKDDVSAINYDEIKDLIFSDFITNFIDNRPNEPKQTIILDCLIENKVFFGGKYINDIINKKENATIEIFISINNIVNFLRIISYTNKNKSSNDLLEQLTFSLNFNSKYNEINYVNTSTNKNIKIYVINDDNIIDKILDTSIEEDKLWYDCENDEITSIKTFEPLKPSHHFRRSYETEHKLFEDIIIEIIKYIPSYISLSDISGERLFKNSIDIKSIYDNYIYNYPAICFIFLIELKDNYTYETLSNVYYKKIMKQTIPNTVIDLNYIITQIYINSFLNKYEICLSLESDNTIQFNINEPKIFSQEEDVNIRKLLLFYYKYNIFKFPYKYKYQKFIIDYGLIDYISPLKSIKTRNLLTLDEEIENFYTEGENKCEFHDIINGIMDIQKEDLKMYLKNKENILIFGRNKKEGFLFSKIDLDKIILENYNQRWLVNCNEFNSDNRNKLLLSVYVKIPIKSEYYISYGNIFSLFNSNVQIYYIVDTENILNRTFTFEKLRKNITIEEINHMRDRFCIDSTATIISKIEQLSTKAIHTFQEDYEPFSKITNRYISLSDIYNKKLNLYNDSKVSLQSAKTSKKPRKAGKKSI
jgi:hypothetical protein